MGLDAGQVRDLIVRPTLKYLGLPGGVAAEKLVLGTAAQESKFKYLKQLGGGPALGIFQMEPATYDDLWARAEGLGVGERWADLAWSKTLRSVTPPPRQTLVWNLLFACAACRIHYYMRRFKLVEDADMPTIAGWYKRHYNTFKGKATVEEFLANWRLTGCEALYR